MSRDYPSLQETIADGFWELTKASNRQADALELIERYLAHAEERAKSDIPTTFAQMDEQLQRDFLDSLGVSPLAIDETIDNLNLED